MFGVRQPQVDGGVSGKGDTLPPEVMSRSIDGNKHGGGVSDIWTGSDVTLNKYGG